MSAIDVTALGLASHVALGWTTDATWTAIHHTDHTEGPLS